MLGVGAPDSPLNHGLASWSRQLAPIVEGCDLTLRQLDGLIQKYGRLATTRESGDIVRQGSNEMDQLGEIRVKLISHKTSLTAFLDSVQLRQSGTSATELDNQKGQLDVILDKVDAIAARMGQRMGNGAAYTENDDGEAWKQFRRELVAEGFSNEVLLQHKDVLRAYIREIDQKGLLDDDVPDSKSLPSQVVTNGQRWLEDVQVPPAAASPSVSSGRMGSDDSGAKEMVGPEENLKFQQSIKLERPKPDSRLDGVIQSRLKSSNPVVQRDQSTALVQKPPLTVPILITNNEKEVHFLGISDSSSDGSSDFDRHASPPRASSAVVIRTVDLLGPSQALQVRGRVSPPGSKNGRGSFSDDLSQSLTYRTKIGNEHGTSPSRPDPVVMPKSILKPPRLAPDNQGNEIPSDAKWTKIHRRLISPEVLAQDKRRFEVRPGFVAVLGVLSRKEIEDYTARSWELRHFRRNGISNAPHVQPPRSARGVRHSTPETSNTASSESDSDQRRRSHRRDNSHDRSARRGGSSYTTKSMPMPVPIFAGRYGAQGPPSPAWSPNPAHNTLHPQPANTTSWSPSQSPSQGQMYYTPAPQPRSQEREHRSRNGSYSHKHSHRERDRVRDRESGRDRGQDREQDKGKGKSRRWKENLTAAGIGAGAVALFETLAEAAEGIDL